MESPEIQVTSSKLGWILESISIAGMIGIVLLVAYSFNLLPQNIPTHYDLAGRPDAINGKGSLLILPVLSIFLYTILTVAPRATRGWNYPVPITEENAARQHGNTIMMLRVFKPLIMMILLYVTFAVVQNGLGKMDGMSIWFIPVTMVSVFGTIGFFLRRAFVLK